MTSKGGLATRRNEPVVSTRLLRVIRSEWTDPGSVFECISGDAIALLLRHAHERGGSKPSYSKRRALLMFDVALRVHGTLKFSSIASLNSADFAKAQQWFYGAMWSPKFITAGEAKRQDTCASLANLLKTVAEVDLSQPLIRRCLGYPEYGRGIPSEWVSAFESVELQQKAQNALKPDLLFASDGSTYRVLLSPMRDALGSTYADQFLFGLQKIAETKKKDTALRDFGTSLSAFVCELSKDNGGIVSSSALLDAERVQELLLDFRYYHYGRYIDRVSPRGRQKDLEATQKTWGRFENYWAALSQQGVVAWPVHAFPTGSPNLQTRSGPRHRASILDVNGESIEVTQKLITTIPLQVTDEEATKLFFGNVRQDFESAQSWLADRLESTWENYQIGKRFQKSALNQLPTISTQYDLAHAIRYFREVHNGYVDTTRVSTPVYPLSKLGRKPSGTSQGVELSLLSACLGLPTKEAAITLVAYLMSTDGRFTEAALADVRIWDKNGGRINATDERGIMLLVTDKHRKRRDGRHDVNLTAEARIRVLQWLELTEPIRRRMREGKVEGWDRLFVYLRSPLGASSYLRRSLPLTASFRVMCENHGEALGPLRRTLTPTRIRAQKGLMRFLQNFSIKEMAEELGNEPETTISSYLPTAAWDFFARRWVRIFQSLIIIKAAHKSSHILRATGFDNMKDVDVLLKNHTLAVPTRGTHFKKNHEGEDGDLAGVEVVVSVSAESLSLMASIAEAVKLARGSGKRVLVEALHWNEFFSHLQDHIGSRAFHDAGLRRMLHEAVAAADASKVEGLVYG